MKLGICGCCVCSALQTRSKDDELTPERKALGAGVFGVRARGVRSRYRERGKGLSPWFEDPLIDRGRAPGGHFAPTIKKMPLPDAVEKLRTLRVVEELQGLVSKARIPMLKLGQASDYRKELLAQACAEMYALRDALPKIAVDRAERRLHKQFRELR